MLERRKLHSDTLGRDVPLHIFVPDDSMIPCPVLYLHDGDVFYEPPDGKLNTGSLYFGEYYEAYRDFLPRLIIVGIEPPHDRWARTAELSPYTKFFAPHGVDFEPVVHGRGKVLAAWMVNELKPYIDANYPTLPSREYTAVGGFSSGALNAAYCAMAYNDVFGRLLLHGPAFNLWLDHLLETAASSDFCTLRYCYMDIGTNDFTRMSSQRDTMAAALQMRDVMLARGLMPERLRFFAIPDGRHELSTWRWTFPDALRWIFQDQV